MWFLVNWNRLAVLLLPTFLRSEVMKAWVQLQLSAIADIHYWWMEYRKANIYTLAHNSQKCYMRGAFNDKFDKELRRIRIGKGNSFKRKYIYTDGEEKPKFLGTIFLYDDSDYADTGVDFIVYVPIDLVYSDFAMKAEIDKYRLASKRYKIVKE